MPVNSPGPEWVMNHQQLQDLQRANDDNDATNEEKIGEIPSFNPKARLTDDTSHQNKYATWAKG